jgi:hypothetical protein
MHTALGSLFSSQRHPHPASQQADIHNWPVATPRSWLESCRVPNLRGESSGEWRGGRATQVPGEPRITVPKQHPTITHIPRSPHNKRDMKLLVIQSFPSANLCPKTRSRAPECPTQNRQRWRVSAPRCPATSAISIPREGSWSQDRPDYISKTVDLPVLSEVQALIYQLFPEHPQTISLRLTAPPFKCRIWRRIFFQTMAIT